MSRARLLGSCYASVCGGGDEHSMIFLRDWLNTHIQKEDLNFAL
jgi:hypothetical protein